MGNQRASSDHHHEEEESLFHSYASCPEYHPYFVQSPSSFSHANSSSMNMSVADCSRSSHELAVFSSSHFPMAMAMAALDGRFNPEPAADPRHRRGQDSAARLLSLSRYSSSRGSNNSFLHEKKISYDLQSQGTANAAISAGGSAGERPLCGRHGVGGDPAAGDEEDEEDGEGFGEDGKRRRRRGAGGLLSFGYSSSCACISFQIAWRLAVSIGISLLVFFIFTKPHPPIISVKIGGIREFELGEGIDNSGVVTKMLNCNISLLLQIENRSKLFKLHTHPPSLDMVYGHLHFAASNGVRLEVGSKSWLRYPVYVGTKKKAMYGAGEAMGDMFNSGRGLPLVIHLSLTSSIQMVGSLMKTMYRHRATCVLFLLHNANTNGHGGSLNGGRNHSQSHNTHIIYNSSCITTFYT